MAKGRRRMRDGFRKRRENGRGKGEKEKETRREWEIASGIEHLGRWLGWHKREGEGEVG